jgi:hypothetical protein
MPVKLFSTLLLLLLFFPNANSSHLMGGEITWECQTNGSFKFTMKVYRDCNGIAFNPNNNSLTVFNHPSVTSISLFHVVTNDISPQGPGCFPCGAPGANPGETQEFILQSNDVFLSGVPPAQGWVFAWGVCCRNGAIDNLQYSGSQGFTLRAIMYPYNNQNTNPCFDSSPYFVEKPDILMCTRYSANYIHQVVDNDLDSLVYDWGEPLNTWSSPSIAYVPPYSYNNPLPQPYHNPNNEAAVMNPMTGEVTFTSYTSGYFIVLTKITSYRCGIKVSEIFREIQLGIINCVIDSGPPVAYNTAPEMNAPFLNPSTGIYDLYTDTVYPGDIISFLLNTSDFDLLQNGSPQTITMTASGSQFGDGFSDASSGCLIPPCATLTPPPPVSAAFGAAMNFDWVVDCSHLQIDSLCQIGPKAYTFVIKAKDDFCPANAFKNAVITIVVEPAPPCIPVGINQFENFISALEIITRSPEEIGINFSVAQTTAVELNIFDLHGRYLTQIKAEASAGKNSFIVSTAGMATGLYLVQITNGLNFTNKKFPVLR